MGVAVSAVSACTRGGGRVEPRPRPAGEIECTESLLDRQLSRFARVEEVKGASGAMRRSAVFDIVFPADRDQFRALNGMAIVGVRVLSTHKSDFPLHSVVFVPDSDRKAAIVRLPVVGRRVPGEDRKLAKEDVIGRKFGDFGEELYALIPVELLAAKGELTVRLESGFTILTLTKLPIRMTLPYLEGSSIPGPDPKGRPDERLITALLKRYYCIKG